MQGYNILSGNKKSLRDQHKEEGYSCSACGVYFQRKHGYPVLCPSCYKSYQDKYLLPRATIPEVAPIIPEKLKAKYKVKVKRKRRKATKEVAVNKP